MATCTVRFFNHEKGFGFITPDNGEQDVFFHVSTLEHGGPSSQIDKEFVALLPEGLLAG